MTKVSALFSSFRIIFAIHLFVGLGGPTSYVQSLSNRIIFVFSVIFRNKNISAFILQNNKIKKRGKRRKKEEKVPRHSQKNDKKFPHSFPSFRAFSKSNNSKERRSVHTLGCFRNLVKEVKGEKNSFPPILLRPIYSLRSQGVSASFPSFLQYFRKPVICRARRPDLLLKCMGIIIAEDKIFRIIFVPSHYFRNPV